MIELSYGYKMFDCTLQEWNAYVVDCYDNKELADPSGKFLYVCFHSVEHGIRLIKNIFIPPEDENLASINWSLKEGQTMLIKNVKFSNNEDREFYQSAVERAWALGGHLDPRVQQFYYD